MLKNEYIIAIIVLGSIIGSMVSFFNPWFAQIGILLYGMPALFVVAYKEHNIRRWAYIIGAMGQPFWFITTIQNKQWGMFVLCVFYTGSWLNGIYHHWIKK